MPIYEPASRDALVLMVPCTVNSCVIRGVVGSGRPMGGWLALLLVPAL